MELSGDKIASLFQEIGGISAKIDELSKRLFEDESGELPRIYDLFERIVTQIEEERHAREMAIKELEIKLASVQRRPGRRAKTIGWGAIIGVLTEAVYRGWEILSSVWFHRGGPTK